MGGAAAAGVDMNAYDRLDLERFRSIIAARLGLQFDAEKFDLLRDVLRRRMHALGLGRTAAYLDLLAQGSGPEEFRALACALTVAETYFFRGTDQFRALKESVLPERIRSCGPLRRLRLLSAGCASGEEPYSLAMLMREHFAEVDSGQVTIVAMDVNPAMLEKARAGRYGAWSLRATPAAIRTSYFRLDSKEYVLHDSIRNMVTFKERNLASDGEPIWPDGEFDIVLCRNVLMYLTAEAAQCVTARLTRAMAPDGYLFLGHAETLRGLSHDFVLQRGGETFYYRRRGASGRDAERSYEPAGASPLDTGETAWVDVIRNASQRINDLAHTPLSHTENRRPDARRRAPVELALAVDLLGREKFEQALDLLRGLPQEAAANPDAQLLQAVLLVNAGDLSKAESVCRELLAADDLNAGAHYVAALCREAAGDAGGAVEHDRAAIYLDNTFAMPHLHLARLAKQQRDPETAACEFQHAAALLLREDASRILLFGGGFSREALVEFSRAQCPTYGGR